MAGLGGLDGLIQTVQTVACFSDGENPVSIYVRGRRLRAGYGDED